MNKSITQEHQNDKQISESMWHMNLSKDFLLDFMSLLL